MNIKVSRIILSFEALIICLPLTMLYIFTVLPAQYYFLRKNPFESDAVVIMISLVILAGLAAGWRLILSFIFHGHEHLVKLSAIWWFIVSILAVLSIAAFIRAAFATELNPSSFNSLGWGIILVLPYIHLLFERLRKISTNKSSGKTGANDAPPG